MNIQNTPQAGDKQPTPKRYVVAGAGFLAGLFAASHLPPIGFYIMMVVLAWPIQAWQKAHPEDEMIGWWVVILGYPLNLLLYAVAGALLALKIPVLVNFMKRRAA